MQTIAGQLKIYKKYLNPQFFANVKKSVGGLALNSM
jgi:hypothetical protein